jgi:hypothetical protein
MRLEAETGLRQRERTKRIFETLSSPAAIGEESFRSINQAVNPNAI